MASSCALAGAKKRIVVVAHRGAHASAPENSLASIRKAIEMGCDYVELDVRETKDGALVLMHDRNVERMTDGAGEIAAMTLEEVQKLRFKRGPEWSGERVPAFEEALEICRGKIKVYVDNKSGPPERVMAAIEKHGMVREVVIYDSVARLRAFKSLQPAVWIMPDHPRTRDEMTALLSSLKPETLDGKASDWTVEEVDTARRGGAEVWVDNLGLSDNEQGYQLSIRMEVDGIQTDHPEELLDLLKKLGHR
jgi:glycerophosphoryl diester phosphodiesterase